MRKALLTWTSPEGLVDLDFALVVNPGNPEQDHALGLDGPLEDLGLPVLRTFVQDGPDGLDDFFDRLMELHLRGVLGNHVFHEGSNVLSHFRSP